MHLDFITLFHFLIIIFTLPILNTLYFFMRSDVDRTDRHGMLPSIGAMNVMRDYVVFTALTFLILLVSVPVYMIGKTNGVLTPAYVSLMSMCIATVVMERICFYFIHMRVNTMIRDSSLRLIAQFIIIMAAICLCILKGLTYQ